MQGRIVDMRNPVQGYAQESFPTSMVYSQQSKRLKTAQHRMNRANKMARFQMLKTGDGPGALMNESSAELAEGSFRQSLQGLSFRRVEAPTAADSRS